MLRAHIDGTLQKLVSHSLRQRIFGLSYYRTSSSHPEHRRMYNEMRQNYFCPNMALNVCETVSSCKTWATNSSNGTRRRHLHLFPAKGSLKFVARNNFGPLPNMTKAKRHANIVSDCYPEPKQAIHTARTAANIGTYIVSNAWVVQ